MCRGGLSAHGRASPALNAEAFPRDSADSPTTGLGRMCTSPRPAPHHMPDPNGTRLDNRVRDRNTARRRPRPIADHRFLRARPAQPDDDWPEDTTDPWPAPEFLDKKTLCIYNCAVLPDTTATSCTSTSSRLNAPTGAWCSLTPSCAAAPSRGSKSLNAPTGAWCSLTSIPALLLTRRLGSQCTYRCVVLPDNTIKLSPRARILVSMHLQVRGAP